MRHFVVFAAQAHPSVWLIKAETLLAAVGNYIEGEWLDAYKDGKWSVPDGYGGKHIYEHPIEYLEQQEKCDYTWNITELTDAHWNSPFAEAMCADNPWEIKSYITDALPARQHAQPGKKPRAFVWYLQDGPLVTFYERVRKKGAKRIQVTERFSMPWKTYPQAFAWNGTYDDIAAQLKAGPYAGSADLL